MIRRPVADAGPDPEQSDLGERRNDVLRDAEVGVQRLEADRGVILRRPATADQDRSRRGLLQGQALAGEVDEVPK